MAVIVCVVTDPTATAGPPDHRAPRDSVARHHPVDPPDSVDRHAPVDPSPSDSLGRQNPVDLPRWLTGEWAVTRVINGGAGRFEGHARFTRDPHAPAALLWHERGRLRLGAHDGPAERTLRIEPAGHGAWQVRFADGRPFHALDLSRGRCEATHPCGADLYRGSYAIESADRFTVSWRATGPRKDDLIESVYDRA
jgi:hypothetical protein